MEAAVVLDRDWRPIHFHTPAGRTGGSLPDSHDLWTVLWEHRETLLGVAHSHPGAGLPWPSHTDVTTFAAVEAGLGARLFWPIVTTEALRVFVWQGPGRLDYGQAPLGFTIGNLDPLHSERGLGVLDFDWVPELLRLSQ